MRFKPIIVLLFLALAGLVSVGCAEKKTRGVTFEGPKSEVSLQVETTDKDPDDDE